MAWRYTPGKLVLSGFIVLAILRAIWLLSEVHVATRDVDKNAITRETVRHICTYKDSDLPSLIWSHRAHSSDQEMDGSQAAVDQLLKAGIRNFDVDVSCKTTTNSDNCEFVIAHPSTFSDKDKLEQRKQVQTVTAFLDQIFSFCQAENDIQQPAAGLAVKTLRPTITLEMKFTQLAAQIEFVKLVQQSRLATHVAIIGTDPSILRNLVPYLTHSGLAAAYRSKPFTAQDYAWPEAAYNEWQSLQSGWIFYDGDAATTSFTPVPPPLISITHTGNEALTKAEARQQILSDTSSTTSTAVLEREVSVPADTQTILIQTERPVDRSYLQVYMPDAKLLKHQLLWQRVADRVRDTLDARVPATSVPATVGAELTSAGGLGEVIGATVSSISNSLRESGLVSSDTGSSDSNAVPVVSNAVPSKRDPQRIVVVWVVDSVAQLWDVLGKGVDGVISNRPVQLLGELTAAHALYCSGTV